MLRPWRRTQGTATLLALILLAAAALRVAGHNWDANQHLNADDSYVAKVTFSRVHIPAGATLGGLLDPAHSPLNPRTGGEFWVYGTLAPYVVHATTVALAAATGNPYFATYDGTLQTGRVLAGLFDTATALLVFAIGALLWDRAAGLLAAALYACAIVPIQAGHFYIVDPFMTTFMTATLAASVAFATTGRRRFAVLAGLATGLAVACKLSAVVVVVLPLAALTLRAWAARHPGDPNPPAPFPAREGGGTRLRASGWGVHWRGAGPAPATSPGGRALLTTALLVLAAAGLGLLLGDPFAVLDAPTYAARLSAQAAIQNGAIDQWFSRKYVGTAPVLYLGGQMLLLATGPLVGLAGTAGLAAIAARARRLPRPAALLLPLGALVYFASVAFVEIKWVRYLLPLAPYLCLGAAFVSGQWSVVSDQRRGVRGQGLGVRDVEVGGQGSAVRMQELQFIIQHSTFNIILAGLLLGSAVLGGLAVEAIFLAPQTQVAASRWIYTHVPAERRIGVETTTIALPLPLPGAAVQQYGLVRYDPLADQASTQESGALHSWLRKSDYLVLDLTQAALTVPRLPWRYPVQIRFYALLRAGRLGFTPVYTATSYPTVLGLAIPDDGGPVDASFMDSSHPPIAILQKTRTLDDAEWDALFADAVRQPSVASRHAP